jgi:hypothetical protein
MWGIFSLLHSQVPATCPYTEPLVTMAWCILRLQMEEQPSVWKVAVNILNEQSRTAIKGLGVLRGVDNSSPSKLAL